MYSTKDKIFYERLSKRELSDQEVFEAKNNFVGAFNLLIQIDKRLNEKNESNKMQQNATLAGSDAKAKKVGDSLN